MGDGVFGPDDFFDPQYVTSRPSISVIQKMSRENIGSETKNGPDKGKQDAAPAGPQYGRHFNIFGIAENDAGSRLAIKRYQVAVNRIINWARKNGIPLSKVFVGGSFGNLCKGGGKLPRLGIIDSAMFFITPKGPKPSDLDVVINIGIRTLRKLRDALKRMQLDVLRRHGVCISYFFEKPDGRDIPIQGLRNNGLIKVYDGLTNDSSGGAGRCGSRRHNLRHHDDGDFDMSRSGFVGRQPGITPRGVFFADQSGVSEFQRPDDAAPVKQQSDGHFAQKPIDKDIGGNGPKSAFQASMAERKAEDNPASHTDRSLGEGATAAGQSDGGHFTQKSLVPNKQKRNGHDTSDVKIIGAGASYGGYAVLRKIIEGLPAIHPPIVVSEHRLPDIDFIAFARISPRKIVFISDGDQGIALEPNCIYIGQSVYLRRSDAGITIVDTYDLFRPGREPRAYEGLKGSVNILFTSAARLFPGSAVGLVLSGRGFDGVFGAHEICKNNGQVYAQEKPSYWERGMSFMPEHVASQTSCQVLSVEGLLSVVSAICDSDAVRADDRAAAGREGISVYRKGGSSVGREGGSTGAKLWGSIVSSVDAFSTAGWYENKLFVRNNQTGRVEPLHIVRSSEMQNCGLSGLVERGLNEWTRSQLASQISVDTLKREMYSSECCFLVSEDSRVQGYMRICSHKRPQLQAGPIFISYSILFAPWNEPALGPARIYSGIHHQLTAYFMKTMTERHGKILVELLGGNCPLIARFNALGIDSEKGFYDQDDAVKVLRGQEVKIRNLLSKQAGNRAAVIPTITAPAGMEKGLSVGAGLKPAHTEASNEGITSAASAPVGQNAKDKINSGNGLGARRVVLAGTSQLAHVGFYAVILFILSGAIISAGMALEYFFHILYYAVAADILIFISLVILRILWVSSKLRQPLSVTLFPYLYDLDGSQFEKIKDYLKYYKQSGLDAIGFLGLFTTLGFVSARIILNISHTTVYYWPGFFACVCWGLFLLTVSVYLKSKYTQLMDSNKDKLITTGIYAYHRLPIYFISLFIFLPCVILFWGVFSLAAFMSVIIFLAVAAINENMDLWRRFGKKYTLYAASRPLLLEKAVISLSDLLGRTARQKVEPNYGITELFRRGRPRAAEDLINSLDPKTQIMAFPEVASALAIPAWKFAHVVDKDIARLICLEEKPAVINPQAVYRGGRKPSPKTLWSIHGKENAWVAGAAPAGQQRGGTFHSEVTRWQRDRKKRSEYSKGAFPRHDFIICISNIICIFIAWFLISDVVSTIIPYGIFVDLIFFSPLLEEVLCRRIFFRDILTQVKSLGINKGIIISSLITTAMHIGTPAYVLPSIFLNAILYASVYVRTKSLKYSIICHSAWNLIALTVSPLLSAHVILILSLQLFFVSLLFPRIKHQEAFIKSIIGIQYSDSMDTAPTPRAAGIAAGSRRGKVIFPLLLCILGITLLASAGLLLVSHLPCLTALLGGHGAEAMAGLPWGLMAVGMVVSGESLSGDGKLEDKTRAVAARPRNFAVGRRGKNPPDVRLTDKALVCSYLAIPINRGDISFGTTKQIVPSEKNAADNPLFEDIYGHAKYRRLESYYGKEMPSILNTETGFLNENIPFLEKVDGLFIHLHNKYIYPRYRILRPRHPGMCYVMADQVATYFKDAGYKTWSAEIGSQNCAIVLDEKNDQLYLIDFTLSQYVLRSGTYVYQEKYYFPYLELVLANPYVRKRLEQARRKAPRGNGSGRNGPGAPIFEIPGTRYLIPGFCTPTAARGRASNCS
ncbi:MAG: chemotaxis protein CheB, partial [Candidatus Omnitrophota bacterium]|nr:chemotaxis protein CheB [Candidatus Omnitrophota bacterium]